ncbi:MAG: ferredoxin [Candidatus Nanopelagicales bacterium]
MTTLTIDWTRCQGHGVCLAAFPERLDGDRWGYPQGVDTRGSELAPDEISAARTAVATCPAAALRLRDRRA